MPLRFQMMPRRVPSFSSLDAKRRPSTRGNSKTVIIAMGTAVLCGLMFVLGTQLRGARDLHLRAAETRQFDSLSFSSWVATPSDPDAARWRALSADVKNATADAFNAYMMYARGTDEFLPLSKKGINTFGGMGLTVVDALDTLYMMDLKDEYASALEFVTNNFSLRDKYKINTFELCIRLLGGLLSIFDLTGEAVYLEKAIEVGTILLGAFYVKDSWLLPCGHVLPFGTRAPYETSSNSVPRPADCETHFGTNAEIGTLTLEFKVLSQRTGDDRWSTAADTVTAYFEERSRDPDKLPLRKDVDLESGRMSGEMTVRCAQTMTNAMTRVFLSHERDHHGVLIHMYVCVCVCALCWTAVASTQRMNTF